MNYPALHGFVQKRTPQPSIEAPITCQKISFPIYFNEVPSSFPLLGPGILGQELLQEITQVGGVGAVLASRVSGRCPGRSTRGQSVAAFFFLLNNL